MMPSSSRPSVKRRIWYNMPKHLSKKKIAAHLSSDLRSRYGRRSISVRKGDRVVILKGDFKGVEGEVVRVDRKKGKLFVEGASRENARGNRVLVPISPSIVVVVKLYEDDKRRSALRAKPGKTPDQKGGAG